MNRKEITLAVMASAGTATFSPVQIQKLLFLVDENIGSQIGGKQFSFVPYDYGPFDVDVYRELEALETEGAVAIGSNGRWKSYALTEDGVSRGKEVLNTLSPPIAEYLSQLVNWVRSLRFSELVSQVYKMYPEMKANSVFKH